MKHSLLTFISLFMAPMASERSVQGHPVENQGYHQGGIGGICYLSDGIQGTCIELEHCDIANQVMAYANFHYLDYLYSLHCGKENNIQYVCCIDEYTITDTEPQYPITPATVGPEPVTDPDSGKTIEEICGQVNVKRAKTRIVGGKTALQDAWPWMVAIFFNNYKISVSCGGTLISSEYVLTAAHCFFSEDTKTTDPPSAFTARLGDLDISTDTDGALPIEIAISEVIPHPQFDYQTYENDIALLRLAQPITFSESIRPICLPDEELQREDLAGLSATLAGWGNISDKASSPILMQVELNVVSNDQCQIKYRRTIFSTHLCAGGYDGKNVCPGDSGGPLMLKIQEKEDARWFEIGIVSLGPRPCNAPDNPGIYTRVSDYLDWIKMNVEFE